MTGSRDRDRTTPLHSPVQKAGRGQIRVRIGALTDPGLVRTNNEDSFTVADLSSPPPPGDAAGKAPQDGEGGSAAAPESGPAAAPGAPEPEAAAEPPPTGGGDPGAESAAPAAAGAGDTTDSAPFAMHDPEPESGAGAFTGGLLGPRGVLLAVSDGMGGHSAGEVASRLAVKNLREQLQAEWGLRPERDAVAELRNDMRVSVDRANRAVLAHGAANPDRDGMGATLTAAVVLGPRMVLAHIGDSRCYLLRDGFLKCLTNDQSLAEELVRRGIVERGSPAYLARRSVLTRVIGQKGLLEADMEVVDLAHGDRVLLCSDGLYGPVPDDTILEILDESAEPSEAVAALVAEARSRGAPDNVTCVAAFLDGEGLPGPSEEDVGGGTQSVAIEAALATMEDATLGFSREGGDDTGEFAPAAVEADDTLSGTVAPRAPADPPPPPEPERAAAPPPSSTTTAPPPSPPGDAAPPPSAPPPEPPVGPSPVEVPPSPAPPAGDAPAAPPSGRRLPTPVLVVLVIIAFALVLLTLVDFQLMDF